MEPIGFQLGVDGYMILYYAEDSAKGKRLFPSSVLVNMLKKLCYGT